MAEQGFILDIDTQFLQRLEKADKALDKMVSSVDRVASSLDGLASGSLSNFANSIDQIVASINGLSQTKVGDMGLSEVSEKATEAADSVNRVLDVMSKLQVGDTSYSNNALSKNTQELETSIAELSSIQTQIHETLDSELEYVDTSELIERSNFLMGYIESLEKERESIIETSKVKIKDAKEQEELDKRWRKMEDERNEVIKERARIESELAKRSSQNYASGFRGERLASQLEYADKQKEYERLFGPIARADQKMMEMYAKQNKAAKESSEIAVKEFRAQEIAYKKMFDSIYAKEKAQSDKQNTEKANKEAQAGKERYELWLMQKHAEAKEHKRIEDEKYKNTLETIRKQNEEYDKQEALQKAYDEQNRLAKAGGNEARENYARQIHGYEEMYDEINKRRKENERKEEASIAREDAANKRKAQSVIDNYIKETNAARDSYEKRRKMYEDLFKQQEEQERRTLSGAMGFSQGASSISERQQAVKYLSEARDSLNESQFNSAKEYKKAVGDINKEINRQKKYVDELRDKHKTLINTADQLKRAFTLAFSVSAIRGYVNQIIRVRGEFELQQRALQAILKNKDEANKLWDQTTQLAVRSPYQVKELVTYTKQLAAYRVETEKLHDTTKMLADISSGLGVDMGRLILAFGQVKAANYLRGTELRQFSEAGINILDELARYYTAVEGKTVTVGQVFERVSKRMVTFSDVETVLRNVTSAGGMFYKMQEIQAETLKGSISNLKDQLDLMLNDIGKSNEGTIKLAVKLVSLLISNYKALIPVVSMATIAFVGMNVSMLKVKLGASALEAGMKTLKSSLVNPWAIALVAIGNVVSSYVEYRHELNEIEKEHKHLADSLSEISIAMNDAFSDKSIEGARVALSQLLETAANDFGIDFGLSNEDIQKMDLSALVAKFEELREVLFDSNVIAQKIKEGYAKSQRTESTAGRALTLWGTFGFGGHGGESMATDIKQYQDSASKLLSTLQEASISISEELKLPKDHPLRRLQEADETDLRYLNRLMEGFESVKAEMEMRGLDTSEIDKYYRRFSKRQDEALREAKRELDKYKDDFASMSPNAIRGAINSFVTSNEWNDYTRELMLWALGLPMVAKGKTTTETVDLEAENGVGEGAKDTRWQDLLRTIKEVNKAYKDLNKTFDETEAKEGTMAKYAEALDDVLSKVRINGMQMTSSSFMEMFDLTTEEGMLKALDMIAKEAPDAADRLKAKLEKGEIVWEAKIKTKEENDLGIKRQIEDLFSGYELSIELDKLNIPASFAKDFFNLESLTLAELRAKVESMRPQFVGKEMEAEYNDYLKKISEMEAKAQQERLKEYLAYARDAVGERAKIKLEELKKLQEIEIAFARKPFETEQERNVRETAKASAIEGVQNEAYQATKKLEWEDFQKSDTFISIFQDLDMASEALLNHAITKLQEFKNNWRDMPHEEMKSIVQNIEKLEMQLASMGNPFKGYVKLKKELDGVGSIEEIQLDTMNQEAKIEALDKELSISEQVLSLHQEGKDSEADELAMANERLDLFGAIAKEVKDIVDAQKNSKNEAQGQIAANNGNLSKIKAAKAELLKQADTMGEIQKMANDLYGAFKELNEVLSDSDGPSAIFAEMGVSMMDSVLNCIMLQKQLKAASEGADAFGKAMNKAMGVIGWIVMAVQVISSVLGAIFKAHDNKLERQIQRIQSRVEELNDRFEKLNELMDKAFSTEAISAYSLEAQKNIKEQIEAYDRMIELEKDKKKTDSAKIKEYREAQRELQEQYEELIAEVFSKATGGILDDTLSAARGFVDAWYEAFKETGSGLGGLKKHFQELFKELALQQMTLQVMTPYVNMLKDRLADYINPDTGDTVLTPEEAQDLKNFWEAIAQDANTNLSNLANALGLADMEQSELSDLSKGIQGVTESTAQVLEALLNSMRFFVADSNTQLRDLKAAFMSSDVTMNPILNELKQHTQLIRSIESMFDSVIGRGGSSHNGAYIRVLV